MRLDHLLSKEHSTARRYTTGFTVPSHFGNTCFPVALMGGTLTLMRNQTVRSQYSASADGTGWSGRVCICTLLGPEGPEQPGSPGWTFPLDLFLSPSIGARRRYRPYFENYTVDASILNLTVFVPFRCRAANYKDQRKYRLFGGVMR